MPDKFFIVDEVEPLDEEKLRVIADIMKGSKFAMTEYMGTPKSKANPLSKVFAEALKEPLFAALTADRVARIKKTIQSALPEAVVTDLKPFADVPDRFTATIEFRLPEEPQPQPDVQALVTQVQSLLVRLGERLGIPPIADLCTTLEASQQALLASKHQLIVPPQASEPEKPKERMLQFFAYETLGMNVEGMSESEKNELLRQGWSPNPEPPLAWNESMNFNPPANTRSPQEVLDEGMTHLMNGMGIPPHLHPEAQAATAHIVEPLKEAHDGTAMGLVSAGGYELVSTEYEGGQSYTPREFTNEQIAALEGLSFSHPRTDKLDRSVATDEPVRVLAGGLTFRCAKCGADYETRQVPSKCVCGSEIFLGPPSLPLPKEIDIRDLFPSVPVPPGEDIPGVPLDGTPVTIRDEDNPGISIPFSRIPVFSIHDGIPVKHAVSTDKNGLVTEFVQMELPGKLLPATRYYEEVPGDDDPKPIIVGG